MRFFGAIVLAILMSGLFSQRALAERRVALVIGNSDYQNVSHLPNPANDAGKLAETFRQAKFDVVTLLTNLPRAAMRKALRDFGDQARNADIAVVYYAGHGIEVDGNNYLIPIDAVLERDTDIYDEAFSLERVLVTVEPARQLRLVILDACRDNPFARTMKRTIALRGIGRGLAKVEPTSPNTMIAFAAKAGSTASDGDGANSPFATALTDHLTTPGLDLRKAFGFVRDDVLKATGNQQEPFIYGSLGGNDVALVSAPAAPPPDPNAAGRRDYELAEHVGTREGWDSFLSAYPDGFYARLAQAQRNKLAAEEARLAAIEQARIAAEQKARLEAESARAAEQARAAAEAKAAEQARLAAETNKATEDAKIAQGERARQAAEKAALDRLAKAEADAKAAAEKAKAAEDARIGEEARIAALQKALEDAKRADARPPSQLAAGTPSDKPEPATAAGDTPRLLLTELRRVGCYTGSIEGNWGEAAQRSLALFNRHAGTTLDTRLASLDTLEVVRGRTARVCPLVCDRGYKADGDSCMRITCKAGFDLDEGGTCVKMQSRKAEAKRDSRPDRPEEVRANVSPPQGGGDVESRLHHCEATSCSQALRGCIRKGSLVGVNNSGICTARYQACLQTGQFSGRYCSLSGLARN